MCARDDSGRPIDAGEILGEKVHHDRRTGQISKPHQPTGIFVLRKTVTDIRVQRLVVAPRHAEITGTASDVMIR